MAEPTTSACVEEANGALGGPRPDVRPCGRTHDLSPCRRSEWRARWDSPRRAAVWPNPRPQPVSKKRMARSVGLAPTGGRVAEPTTSACVEEANGALGGTRTH